MRVLIENYRGFDIWFDTDNEIFYAASDSQDVGKEKRSYSAAIKYVDDFIKENLVFEPFWVVNTEGTKKRIVGIRKDGYFVEEKSDGSKSQFSSLDENYYYEYTPETKDPLFDEIVVLDEQFKALVKKISELRGKLFENQVPLKDLKSRYIK
jgi:hypothetical protein